MGGSLSQEGKRRRSRRRALSSMNYGSKGERRRKRREYSPKRIPLKIVT